MVYNLIKIALDCTFLWGCGQNNCFPWSASFAPTDYQVFLFDSGNERNFAGRQRKISIGILFLRKIRRSGSTKLSSCLNIYSSGIQTVKMSKIKIKDFIFTSKTIRKLSTVQYCSLMKEGTNFYIFIT